MKRTLLLAGLGVMVVGLLAGFGFGHGPFHRGPMDPKKVDNFLTWRINDALDDVQATPAQRQQVLAIKDRLMPDVKTLMEDGRQTHEQVRDIWKSNADPDPKQLHALVDQRVEAFRAFGYKIADAMADLHKVLTPAQRATLTQKAEQHHPQMEPQHP